MNRMLICCGVATGQKITGKGFVNCLVTIGLTLALWMTDSLIIAAVNPDSTLGVANAQEDKPKRKTKRTPAMREKVYKKLAQAQELAENKNYAKALEILNEVKADPGLNCYEIAMAWNFIAYVYTVDGNYDRALPAYNNILKQECIPDALEQQTLFAISQMHLALDRPRDAIKALKKWFTIATPNPQAHVMLGQCYFLIDDFRSAVKETEKALVMVKAQGGEPRENWLLILRAAYYELNNIPKVTEALEELVRLYPKGDYFMQLSSMYGEQNNEKKQVLVLEASYDGGYFRKSGEYVALASLLLNQDVPYKSAKVMSEGIKKKIVKEKINTLKILAQAWLAAQEPRESIKILDQAAKQSKDGELYIRLGQSHMNLDEWAPCVKALKSGIKKGGLQRPDSAQISLGICLYNTDNLDAAISAFKKAAEDDRSVRFAKSWIDFLRSEKARRQAIEASLI